MKNLNMKNLNSDKTQETSGIKSFTKKFMLTTAAAIGALTITLNNCGERVREPPREVCSSNVIELQKEAQLGVNGKLDLPSGHRLVVINIYSDSVEFSIYKRDANTPADSDGVYIRDFTVPNNTVTILKNGDVEIIVAVCGINYEKQTAVVKADTNVDIPRIPDAGTDTKEASIDAEDAGLDIEGDSSVTDAEVDTGTDIGQDASLDGGDVEVVPDAELDAGTDIEGDSSVTDAELDGSSADVEVVPDAELDAGTDAKEDSTDAGMQCQEPQETIVDSEKMVFALGVNEKTHSVSTTTEELPDCDQKTVLTNEENTFEPGIPPEKQQLVEVKPTIMNLLNGSKVVTNLNPASVAYGIEYMPAQIMVVGTSLQLTPDYTLTLDEIIQLGNDQLASYVLKGPGLPQNGKPYLLAKGDDPVRLPIDNMELYLKQYEIGQVGVVNGLTTIPNDGTAVYQGSNYTMTILSDDTGMITGITFTRQQ